MAVEVKYVVIRGEEKMSFTSKKEAVHGTKCSILPRLLDARRAVASRAGKWAARGVVAVAGGT